MRSTLHTFCDGSSSNSTMRQGSSLLKLMTVILGVTQERFVTQMDVLRLGKGRMAIQEKFRNREREKVNSEYIGVF